MTPRVDIDRRARGAIVESAARAFLVAHGLQLIASNVACRGGELDLVLRDGETVVFVEVRYRASDAYASGAASVDAAKRRRLIHAARTFLHANPALANHPCRFDVIDATGNPAAPTLRWLRAAFST